MEGCERGGDFYDFKARSQVDFGVKGTDVVEDVEHESTIASTKLVYGKVVERVIAQLVIGHEVAGNGFAVVRPEELSGRMPQLTGFVRVVSVELVLEVSVAST